MPIYVRGYRELDLAYAKLERQTRTGFRLAMRDVAEPVRRDAESLAQGRISHIGGKWWKMRTGVTRRVVYVAPRQRGVKGTGPDPRRRPEFAEYMLEKAMEPALNKNEFKITEAVDTVLEHVAMDFNRH